MAIVNKVFGRNTLSYVTVFDDVECATNADGDFGFHIVYRRASGGSYHSLPIHFHPDDANGNGAAVEMAWALQGSDNGCGAPPTALPLPCKNAPTLTEPASALLAGTAAQAATGCH